MNEMQQRHYIKELPDGSYRDSTPKEIDDALLLSAELLRLYAIKKDAEDKIQKLRKSCTHSACWDEDGPIYDMRTCAGCGGSSFI